jgi:hypothetical protein
MPDAINERWKNVCLQAAVEEDPEKFRMLAAEISLLMEQREAELRREHKSPQPASREGAA